MDDQIKKIQKRAVEVFGSPEAAEKWLTEKAYGLGDVAPVDYISQGADAHKEVLALLGRIEHGIFS